LSNNKEAGRRMRLPGFKAIASHNLILDVLTATGVVGAIPFGIGVWHYLRCAWKARHGPHGILAFAVFVSILVANLSVDRLRSKMLWFGFTYAASCATHIAVARKRLAFSSTKDTACLTQDARPAASYRQLLPQVGAHQIRFDANRSL
jgi:O-antigen ligase